MSAGRPTVSLADFRAMTRTEARRAVLGKRGALLANVASLRAGAANVASGRADGSYRGSFEHGPLMTRQP